MTLCSVSWCDRTVLARGLCDRCYRRRQLGIDRDLPPQVQATRATWDRIRDEASRRRRGGETIKSIATSLGVSADALARRLREWEVGPEVDPVPHGRPSGWLHHKCRCDVCLGARREYKRAERERRQARPVTAGHGTVTAYQQGCECDECGEAMRVYLWERNEATRATASRHGSRWTGADAEIALRSDLTIAERAALLGRTFAAVDNFIRAYHRRPDDPFGLK